MAFQPKLAAANSPVPRSANRPAAYAAQSPSGRSSTPSPESRSSAGQLSVPVSSRSSGRQARPAIGQQRLENPLAVELLQDRYPPGSRIVVDAQEGKLVFAYVE